MKKGIFLLVFALQFITPSLKADTVIALHGFLTDTRSLRSVKNALECSGLTVCLWDYPSRRKRIAEHACDLIPLLEKIACECPGQPIHFVTHSIGALILRAALNIPDCPSEAKIGRAVLLAPPNQGSCLARRFRNLMPVKFAMGDRSGWELMNYDPCQIACFGEFPPSMQVLVIAGTRGNKALFDCQNDGYISVDETRLNTPYTFQSYPVTHGELLTLPKVLCVMRTFLCTGACE